MLILLVVWGHLLEVKGFDDSLYFSIYVFHIPAFAMISGMFSKSKLEVQDVLRICLRLLVPLIAFQILYFQTLSYFAPHRIHGLYAPIWLIWFLLSLLIWKIILPIALKVPYPFILSVFAALLVGFIDEIGRNFSLSRTFVFFPAFLFGHLYGKQAFAAVSNYRIQYCLLFVILFLASYIASEHVDIRWLWGASSYSIMPADTPGVAYRAIAIGVGIIMAVAFFAIAPSHSLCLAWLGRSSMQIYLLHGFPVIIFWMFGFQLDDGLFLFLITATLSLVISFFIARMSSLV